MEFGVGGRIDALKNKKNGQKRKIGISLKCSPQLRSSLSQTPPSTPKIQRHLDVIQDFHPRACRQSIQVTAAPAGVAGMEKHIFTKTTLQNPAHMA